MVFLIFSQLSSKKPCPYLTVFHLIHNPLSRLHNCSLNAFCPHVKYSFLWIYWKMLTPNRQFYAHVAFLAGSIVFSTSCVHSDEFVKVDPKHLNAVVCLISILSSLFIFCMLLLIPWHSGLRILTLPPNLQYSINFLVIHSAPSLFCAIISCMSTKRWWYIVWSPINYYSNINSTETQKAITEVTQLLVGGPCHTHMPDAEQYLRCVL